ncbi:hypothetical protein MSIMFB_02653 [Mycobacterium simulans]|uniref:Uncharacterized protein n=1 Tax=Mycobacterium simulans TaxID=627089 RepID=A0A7Z7IKD0_9MYCO|nr:hypothetical protein MSIMFB_02653 [Mycobacterium simulans]
MKSALVDYVALLPCGYAVADKLVELADIAMISGGHDVFQERAPARRFLGDFLIRTTTGLGGPGWFAKSCKLVAHWSVAQRRQRRQR